MFKFKVICDAPGQTCNRLWSYLDTVSWAIKNGGKVYVINWDVDIKYFPNLLRSRYCSFPFYSQTFFKEEYMCYFVIKLASKEIS